MSSNPLRPSKEDDMTAPETPHTLHVRQEPDADENEFEYSVSCPREPSHDMPCVLFLACGCPGDIDGADSPCPKSPTGQHEYVSSIGMLGCRTTQCYVQSADDLPEAAQEALSDLGHGGVGDYPVEWSCEGENQLELTVVAQ